MTISVSKLCKEVGCSHRKLFGGFTLAEVLITLGIIGVVASITLPTLIDSVTERKYSERHANIVYKVTQAMDIMKAHGELGTTYPSTEAFVDELQKYLKVSKRCDSTHIADCWPTDKVIDADGNEFDVSKAKTGKNLSLSSDTNNVGLILADGAPIILNYNPDAGKLDETDALVAVKKSLPIGGGRSKEFVYTTNSTASIDFVTDVNGSSAPNMETSNNKYNDIRNLAAAKFTKGCAGVEVPSIGCVVDFGKSYNCISEDPYNNGDNCWAGAKAKCESVGMSLPYYITLEAIRGKSSSYPGLPQTGLYWSVNTTNARGAWSVSLGSNLRSGEFRSNKNNVLCVGD